MKRTDRSRSNEPLPKRLLYRLAHKLLAKVVPLNNSGNNASVR